MVLTPLPLQGQSTISRARFRSVLERYGSRCAADSDLYYGILEEARINPAVGLAFFVHESACGTAGKAAVTKSWGNLREGRGTTWEIAPAHEGFARFGSWEDGLRAWCHWLLEGPHYVRAGRTTVEAVVPVYAPSIENDVQTYIDTVRRLVGEWHSGLTREEQAEVAFFVDRDIPMAVCTAVPNPPRPIKGVVLHHTAGSGLPEPRRDGSWHWLVDKDGTIYRDVSEEHCAHHVRETDKWRPAWVEDAPPGIYVSSMNYCSIGIEIVYAPQNGEQPTEAQYGALRTLLTDIYARRGPLPVVGHDQVQGDRYHLGEPCGLDWGSAGLGEPAEGGRLYLAGGTGGGGAPPRPPDDPHELLRQDRNRNFWQKMEFLRYLSEETYRDEVNAKAASEGISPQELLTRRGEANIQNDPPV